MYNFAHKPTIGDLSKVIALLVQDNAQEGRIDTNLMVVLDEAQFLEFIHKEIHSGARCPDHFRQHLLRYFGDHYLWLILFAIACEQQ